MLNVLIAEDTYVNRMLLEKMITRMDAMCVAAEDGSDAMKKFEPGKFDLVMLDINMPGYSGPECAELIMRKCTENSMPIPLMVSMSADDEFSDPSLFFKTLIKPFDMKIIESVLDQVRKNMDDASEYDLDAAGRQIGFDPETMLMLSGEFVTAMDDELKNLNTAVMDKDGDMITHVAHKMKGAAANMYMEPLRQLCADMQTADKNNVEQVTMLSAEINSVYSAFRTVLVSLQS